ncbi:CHAT domain-containing protein [candidate division GN15 bacterium]|nr:CHAT domain-containing protein [candidate division GN15 bacterium]
MTGQRVAMCVWPIITLVTLGGLFSPGCRVRPGGTTTEESTVTLARVRTINVDERFSRKDIAWILATPGGFDHLAVEHSGIGTNSAFFGVGGDVPSAIIGDWFELESLPDDGSDPIAAWILENPNPGEVGVLTIGDSLWAIRCEQTIRPSARVAHGWPDSGILAVTSRGGAAFQVVARPDEVLLALERDLDASGPLAFRTTSQWLGFADSIDSRLLRLRILVRSGMQNSENHVMAVSTAYFNDALQLSTELRINDRFRGLLLAKASDDLQHSLRPHDAVALIARFAPTMNGEARYHALCSLGDALHDLGRYRDAMSSYSAALLLSDNLGHVHGSNVHLLMADSLAHLDRKHEALEATRQGLHFAQDKMHTDDEVDALHHEAVSLIALGDYQSAEQVLDRAFELAADPLVDSNDTRRLHWQRLAIESHIGKPETQIEVIDTILQELPNNAADPARQSILSRSAAAMLPIDESAALELMTSAMDLESASPVDHVDLAAEISFLKWTLESGRGAALARRIGEDLYDSFDAGTKCHEPFRSTNYKQSEQEALSMALRYYWAIGDASRAQRAAERIAGRHILRTLRSVELGGYSISEIVADIVSAPASNGHSVDIHFDSTQLGPDGPRNRHLESVVAGDYDSVLAILNGDDPYPYGDVLGPSDLFVTYVAAGPEILVLWSWQGQSRIESIATYGAEPAATVRTLVNEIEIGPRTPHTVRREMLIRRLSDILLEPIAPYIAQADRLLVATGSVTQELPFTALVLGPGPIGSWIPVISVETGLPVSLPEASKTRPPKGASARLIGDPNGDLVATRSVLSRLGEIPGFDAALGHRATRDEVFRNPRPIALLHIDTHAAASQGSTPGARLQLVDGWLEPNAWLAGRRSPPWMTSVVACRASAFDQNHFGDLDLRNLAGILVATGSQWVLTTKHKVSDEASAAFIDRYFTRVFVDENEPDIAFQNTIAEFVDEEWGFGREWESFSLSFGGHAHGRTR